MPCVTEGVDSRELWMLSYLRKGCTVIHVITVDFHIWWDSKTPNENSAQLLRP
jgi:hypothetical protein